MDKKLRDKIVSAYLEAYHPGDTEKMVKYSHVTATLATISIIVPDEEDATFLRLLSGALEDA